MKHIVWSLIGAASWAAYPHLPGAWKLAACIGFGAWCGWLGAYQMQFESEISYLRGSLVALARRKVEDDD